MQTPRKPEIMSPAGYWPQLRAAIEAGADAVYFGLKHFTARAKVGFEPDELLEVMRTLHRRGVKGYVTFNTLIYDSELADAAQSLAEIARAGADAIIVQDVAVCQLARRIAPDLHVHGSTQMSITSAEGVNLARQFGVRRVVLARELSLDEVRAIRQATDCELEIFVHGALCVSYSGQCFSSEAWGGRSANRGQCAQACRLPYDLLVNGEQRSLGDARYLLSPGDLYALRQMPEIVQIGVSALKIEGRYKDADYVALTTAAYRKAVDEAWAGLPLSITRRDELEIEQIYSRGLGPYFINGVNHQAVVQGRTPRHRGVLMGRVARVQREAVLVATGEAHVASPLKPGDGVVFDAADWRSPEEREEGGRIYEIGDKANGQVELRFGNGVIDFSRIRPGDLVWRTDDPALEKATRVYTQAVAPVRRQPVAVEIVAHEGAPLRLIWRLVEHPQVCVEVEAGEALTPAQSHGLTVETAAGQLGRLGNTPYSLESVRLDRRGEPFAPVSLLNQLRRQAVEQLTARQSQSHIPVNGEPVKVLTAALQQSEGWALSPINGAQKLESALHLLVRTPEQLEAAIDARPAGITLDYLDLYGLRPAVERIQAAGLEARVASPRILKPNEQRIVNFLLRLDCPILVRSTGLLYALQGHDHPALIGDFSLNAANALAADAFLRLGLERITPAHDLNAGQTMGLAQAIGPHRVEVVAYQHLPVFHTEHCVFCRFLSIGTSYKDCGHPCEKQRVALRDHSGRAHPVMADVGCRNTVFGAEAQQASRYMDDWRGAGIRHFRLEFVHESAQEVTQIVKAFAATLTNRQSARELAAQLGRFAPQGVTDGSLFIPQPAPSARIDLIGV
jgi:putative protease